MDIGLQQEQDKVIRAMQKQLANLDYKEIDKKATQQKLVDTELKRVQKATQAAARAVLGSDPRQAYKGVRMTRYKKIFGGNINILSPKSGSVYVINTERVRIRNRYRSERTKQMESYAGPSRSFVLRWIEGGTPGGRVAGTKYSNRGGSGNRGVITAKNFMNTAQNEMANSPQHLWKGIEAIIDKQFEQ